MKKKHNPFKANIKIYYDYDQSHYNFNENFKRSPLTKNNRFNNCPLFQYIDYGNIKLFENNSELFTIKTKSKRKLKEYTKYLDEVDIKEMSVEEIKEEILNEYDFEELYDISDINNELKIERNFLLYNTIGYSQGDYAYVLIPTKELKKVCGETHIPDNELVSKQFIDNVFWDSPIWGKIKIIAEEGQDYEFKLYEIETIPKYLNYSQDIDFVNDEIIKFIKRKFSHAPAIDNILAAVKEALPEEIKFPQSC